jgi:signal transduction histidine kinase
VRTTKPQHTATGVGGSRRGRSLRLRLTALYGGLFLLSGAGLLTVTYLLVQHATGNGNFFVTNGNGVLAGSITGAAPDKATSPPVQLGQGSTGPLGGLRFTPAQLQAQAEQLRAQAIHQHAAELHQFLVQSAIALGIMAVASIALGWIVAGRALRPLRTITAAAREISATNLHERLALTGPEDELKELGDTFDALLARLDASFQSQQQFIANASHELRTPLARQRTLIQVALADPDASEQSLRTTHERVLVAGAQQERLIDTLLTLARGQAGLDTRDPIDLARITEQVVTSRRHHGDCRGLALHATLEPAVTAGSSRLTERLIANLVDNALRHNTPDGSVDIVTGTRNGLAMIAVSNTGPVIPHDAVDQLFEPFKRLGTDRTSHEEGLGLGLSIVQAIADAHQASVHAHALPAGGLCVEVTFPN